MMGIKNFYLKMYVVLLAIAFVGLYGSATTRDWKRYSTIDAFGEERTDQPVFITEVGGTINDRPASVQFKVYCEPRAGFPIIQISLLMNGYVQEFLTENTVLVKLANGKVFDLPCESIGHESYLLLGFTPQEALKILDILNKGSFILSITSKYSAMEGSFRGIFKVSNQTTGITQLVAPIIR